MPIYTPLRFRISPSPRNPKKLLRPPSDTTAADGHVRPPRPPPRVGLLVAPPGPQFAAARGPARPVRGPRGPIRRRALSRAPPPSSPRPAAAAGAVAAPAGGRRRRGHLAARPLPASAPAPLRCLLAGAAPPPATSSPPAHPAAPVSSSSAAGAASASVPRRAQIQIRACTVNPNPPPIFLSP